MSGEVLKPCPICGKKVSIARTENEVGERWWFITRGTYKTTRCNCRLFLESEKFTCGWNDDYSLECRAKLIDRWNTRATHGTLTAEQVMAIAGKHQPDYCSDTHVCFDWQAIADELNELGGGKAKDLLLRTFGLAQMMHDCWLEECKAGDNVDVSACNAYSYEFDQVAQAMFDMGIDPNDSDYYRSAELGSGTCYDKGYIEDDEWYFDCSNCGCEFDYSDFACEFAKGCLFGSPKFCPNCGKAVKR